MRRLILAAAAAWSLVPVAVAEFAVTKWTVDAGGGKSTGCRFSLAGTIGQPDASRASTGGKFSLTGGFWGPIGRYAACKMNFFCFMFLGGEHQLVDQYFDYRLLKAGTEVGYDLIVGLT